MLALIQELRIILVKEILSTRLLKEQHQKTFKCVQIENFQLKTLV